METQIKQVQCTNGPPVLRLTSQTSQKLKILQTDQKSCKSNITLNSMIFFVASMEAKNQFDTSYSF